MTDGYKGTQDPASAASDFNLWSYLITQILNRASTTTLVMVKSVTNAGGDSAVGYVDIQPLVHQVDGNGTIEPHGVIYNVPYFRLQGGANAIILDPQVNDIGIAVFADHDISAVKNAKAAAAPGSSRRFDMADGLYIGGVLNGTPNQYLQFNASGITVLSPSAVKINAPNVTVETQTATVTATTSASVTAPSISLGASGQSLLPLVTSELQTLFNGHTHTGNGAGAATSAPNQTMGAGELTTTVKGG